ncbi:MAG: DUF4012 domain-containing protein [Burkholderiales bacterium]|nr:DUF4012 domain-containing protein [Anaerolineae bacterium]
MLLLIVVKAVTVGLAYLEFSNALSEVRALAAAPDAAALSPSVSRVSAAAGRLAAEARLFSPLLTLAGGDGCAAARLVDIAGAAAITGENFSTITGPLLIAAQTANADSAESGIDITALRDAWPSAGQQAELQTVVARLQSSAPCANVSPAFQEYAEAGDGALLLLDMATNLPLNDMLHDGARWLVVFNNTDELRATGGFTTAYVEITVEDGLLTWELDNSYSADNNDTWDQHPPTPMPMGVYMGLPKWLFRDANWSPDHRTTAQQALDFYVQDNFVPMPDGLITVNMTAIETLARYLPPLEVAGEPFNADNALDRLRQAWGEDADVSSSDSERKDFLVEFASDLANGLIDNLQPRSLPRLVSALREMLHQRDIMIYATDPNIAVYFAARGWDGALLTPIGDYLMVVDSNLGYNKVTPRVEQTIIYSVDLTDAAAPSASLDLNYVNTNENVNYRLCAYHHAGITTRGPDTYDLRMWGCYWDYIRVFFTPGSAMQGYDVHPVPGEWMPIGRHGQRAKIDAWREGAYTGIGTFLIVPTEDSRLVSFEYTLPALVIMPAADGGSRYQLTIQQQAGAPSAELNVHITLPPGASVSSVSPRSMQADLNEVSFNGTLDADWSLVIDYR